MSTQPSVSSDYERITQDLKEMTEHQQTLQEQEEDELVRDFLRLLDTCQTEQERVDAVKILVHGVICSVSKEFE